MKYGQGNMVRLYYTTPQVCEFLQVEPKFLVQLEREFPEIKVDKNKAGKKQYRHKYFVQLKLAIELIRTGFEQQYIHDLLKQAPRSGLDEWVQTELESIHSDSSSVEASAENAPVETELQSARVPKPEPGPGIDLHAIKQELESILALLKP